DFLPLDELAAGAPNAVASQRLPWAVPGDQPAKDARSGFACQGEMHLRDDVIRAANILTGFVSPTTGCCFPAEANCDVLTRQPRPACSRRANRSSGSPP